MNKKILITLLLAGKADFSIMAQHVGIGTNTPYHHELLRGSRPGY